MKNILTFNSFVNEGYAARMASVAVAQALKTPKYNEKPSDKEDEFLIYSRNPDEVISRESLKNGKLIDVKIDKKEPAKGFFSRLFGEGSKIQFTFDCDFENKKKCYMLVELKGKTFKHEWSHAEDDETLQAYMSEEQSEKFIKYALAKSKWKDEIKKEFPEIDKMLIAKDIAAPDL